MQCPCSLLTLCHHNQFAYDDDDDDDDDYDDDEDHPMGLHQASVSFIIKTILHMYKSSSNVSQFA